MLFKLLFNHFKTYKVIFLILILLPLVLVLMAYGAPIFKGETFSIGFYIKVENGAPILTNITSISQAIKQIFMGMIGLGFFIVSSAIATFIVLVNELNKGKILFWSTLPISRTKLILSKKLFVSTVVLIGWLFIFFSSLIVSSISIDADLYLGKVVLDLFQLLLFLILLENLIFLIGLLFYKNNVLYIVLTTLFLAYILFTEFNDINYSANLDTNSNYINFIHYISLQNFISRFAWFNNNINFSNNVNIGNVEYMKADIFFVNITKFSIMLSIEILLLFFIPFTSILVFKRKNLVI